ncbi:hypothetical protein JG687_00008123 [Phytophthora cactorum]|uniref:Uncharacterized protein n=1 Tax=Phytophthora cactorum TaxID=29920 RepID=A0A8T1B981_9STRA|nr:hypothetical protein PC111_g20868 [Phytophthora cactorum]KAG2805188.1 hypothetical protein PC112_g18377 [Phytophthora cactorum]KAG2884848.1 hypothetical protein PC114_g19922 [Phytophthora cactorum]KAG2895554.1 hypothetical protein PC115_g17776 [Phytophthora cactorum]KAG2916743.1 hypothetical protein PC117_g17650 [Phytophthora cactorum]
MPANSAITSISKGNANSSARPSVSSPDISAAATSDSNVNAHGVSTSSSTARAPKTPALTIAFDDTTSVDDTESMLLVDRDLNSGVSESTSIVGAPLK